MLTYPPLLGVPFATSGTKNSIPTAPASPLASLTEGFPPVTMQPISTGGVPPAGADFNGILNWITEFQAWVNAGGRFKFDSTLATAIGGYATGAILLLDDNISEVINLADGNTTNPNISMSNWAPYSGALAGAGNYVLDTGAVNAYVAIQSPPITTYKNGYWIIFQALHTNTGASTLATGAGIVPLKRNDGSAVVAGDIQAGSIYRAIYDQATTAFRLTDLTASQVRAAVTFFTGSAIVTGSRAIGATYTNATGKPMLVNVTVTNGGAASNLNLQVDGVTVVTQGQASPGAVYSVTGMVPPGSTYGVTVSSGGTLTTWTETY